VAKCLGGPKSDEYKTARDAFWQLALETDEFKQSDFESEFNKLVAFVESAETESNTDAIEGFFFFLCDYDYYYYGTTTIIIIIIISPDL
jgi:hypothetical protein